MRQLRPAANTMAASRVYCGMRLLCVARHEYLSTHLCRYFGELGVVCEAAVGLAEASAVAVLFEPHLVVADADLLSAQALERWSGNPALNDVPVLAVSLTSRTDENVTAELSGLAGVIFLPTLEKSEALALLDVARRRERGVRFPVGAALSSPAHSVSAH